MGVDAVLDWRRREILSEAVRVAERQWRRVASALSAARALAMVWVRAQLLPWLRYELTLERARLAFWRAALEHVAALVRCHGRLRLEALAYRARCRGAARAACAAEKEAARLVTHAYARFHALCRPQRLAGCGPYVLFDDGIEGPDWEVSLPSVRAVVVPPKAVALRGGGTRAFPVPATAAGEKRGRLLIRSRRGFSTYDCSADDPRVGEFARLVNVAALNPGSFQETRREHLEQAAEQLEAARAAAAARIADARAGLEAVRRDTALIEAARERLQRAERDTRERELCRARLAAIKASSAAP